MYLIIGGGGEVGYYLARNLLNRGHEVLLLEKYSSRAQFLSEDLGQSVLWGDACEARTMEEAGASRADVVIAVTGEDDDNLVICQMAKKRFNVGRTVARLNNPKYEELFQKLGIDVLVSPTKAILSLIEAELPGPHFVPLMTIHQKAGLEIAEMSLSQLSPVVGKKLQDLQLPLNSNLYLIVRDDKPLFPTPETEFQANDEVYVLVHHKDEATLRRTFGTE